MYATSSGGKLSSFYIFSILAETVDRNNRKYQARYKKMEHQMQTMVERHAAQVQSLQDRIATLETPPTNSSDNSISSFAV